MAESCYLLNPVGCVGSTSACVGNRLRWAGCLRVEIRNLRIAFGANEAVRSVSLSLDEGETGLAREVLLHPRISTRKAFWLRRLRYVRTVTNRWHSWEIQPENGYTWRKDIYMHPNRRMERSFRSPHEPDCNMRFRGRNITKRDV